MYQKRLLDTIVLNENYNKDAEYISVNFGQIDFKERFYSDKLNTDEILGYKLSFDFDVAKNLFWEENQSQVIVSTRIDGNVLLFINRDMGNKKWREGTYWKNNTDSINNIKYWLYKDAKPYPSDNFAYIDDKYMILIIDPLIFYKYRELVIRGLDL